MGATRPDSRAPRMISIVHNYPSTSETFIERKAVALIQEGFDVTIAAHRLRPVVHTGDSVAVPTLQLPMTREPSTWSEAIRSLRSIKSVRSMVRALPQLRRNSWLLPASTGRYDIVHFEFSGTAVRALESLSALRPSLISVSCRGASEQIAPHSDPRRLERLARLFSEVDLIHCVSEDMAATVEGYGADRAKILVNRPAVDTLAWRGVGRVDRIDRGSPENPLRVLSVSRLHWKKGLDDAIRAVAKARQAGVHIEYRVAGEGDEREKLLYLRHSLGLDNAVELLGWQDQDAVRHLLGWTDVFLLPSLSEGISNSALEAMAAGVPVLSTRCGGMQEAIVTGESGLLVDVGDLDGLSESMQALGKHSLRELLAEGGVLRVRDLFDLSRQGSVFAARYRDLLGRANPSG